MTDVALATRRMLQESMFEFEALNNAPVPAPPRRRVGLVSQAQASQLEIWPGDIPAGSGVSTILFAGVLVRNLGFYRLCWKEVDFGVVQITGARINDVFVGVLFEMFTMQIKGTKLYDR